MIKKAFVTDSVDENLTTLSLKTVFPILEKGIFKLPV
jgi:hypothetical protein